MSCITRILELKGDRPILPVVDSPENMIVIEGGGLYKDHEYIIVFVEFGHRCGYVALKENATKKFEEERQEAEYYYPDLSCHGGITFYDSDVRPKDLLDSPCSDIWIGFDAAHFNDNACVDTAFKYFPDNQMAKHRAEREKDDLDLRIYGGREHRSYEYMEGQCHHIINQLVKIENGR